ncbi:hypothetical protein PHLCEN_2v9970, partial [Hermanssonia centrifuga]
MPYATPADPSSSTTTIPQRAGHRRTRSSFTDEHGPGAFVSLGTLPRRRASNSASSTKKPLFHITVDDDSPPEQEQDDHSSSSTPSNSPQPSNSALSIDTSLKGLGVSFGNGGLLTPTNSLRLSMENGRFSPSIIPPSHIDLSNAKSSSVQGVPFPKSSPLSPNGLRAPPSPPRTSSLPRTPSTSIILSNGKPLKPSLKSSTSSPNVSEEFAGRLTKHMRVQSAPSTPRVHFADKDAGLETVRLFNRSGKPASLSKPPGDETETETEAESYPFPLFSSAPSSSSYSSSNSSQLIHEIDATPGATSPIPSHNPSAYANVHVETVTLPRTRPPTLRGTVLVRNLAFEKRVAVRFTLDDWQTTSEVTCKHVVCLPGLPPPFPGSRLVGDMVAGIAAGDKDDEGGSSTWDRFSFTIRLEDYESKLAERTLFLVARYLPVNGVDGEFWDNNNGSNYRIGFRRSAPSPLSTPLRQPFATVSGALADMLSDGGSPTAQQRTFSAPSSMRFTPTTGTVPAVVSRVAAVGEGNNGPRGHGHGHAKVVVPVAIRMPGGSALDTSSSPDIGSSGVANVEGGEEVEKTSVRLDVDAFRGAIPLARRHSSPHASMDMPHFPSPPRSQSPNDAPPPESSSAAKMSPTAAYISRRLSLSNYVAPGTRAPPPPTPPAVATGIATPPSTPPQNGDVPLPDVSDEGKDRHAPTMESSSPPLLSPLVLVGGMPATILDSLIIDPTGNHNNQQHPMSFPFFSSSSSSNSSTPNANSTSFLQPPQLMSRSASLESDDGNAPFSPTSRKAQPFGMQSLGAQLRLGTGAGRSNSGGIVHQLASPPVSRQGSEDGSGHSSPFNGNSGRNTPKERSSSPPPPTPPRRGSPSRLENPALAAVALADDHLDVRTRRSSSPAVDAQALVQGQAGQGKVDTSDSSYAAFVRQWCFAQSTPPTPGVVSGSPSSSSGSPNPIIPGPPTLAASGGASMSVGAASRRQPAWPAEHQVGAGSSMGIGSGYGFPGFGFAGGVHPMAEGMVGGG